MTSFTKIHERALTRKGGETGLAAWLPAPRSAEELTALPDDRYLSMMTRCIFQAGFVWRVVDHKWPDFEKVFFGFVPEKMVLVPPDLWETIAKDTRIIRNMQKIMTVPRNAQFILDIAREHGSFGQFIAQWPSNNLIGLLEILRKRGERLGGNTGMRVLRNMGKDTFVLSSDVLFCLKDAGLDIDKGTTKRELRLIQKTFNEWHEQTGLPFCQLSRICSCSVGENYFEAPAKEDSE